MFDNKDIITIGESLIEMSCESSLAVSENFKRSYGGDTLISAIAALKMGAKVGYITKVGNDIFGEYLLDAWQSEGLDISQIKLANGPNGIYFVGRDDNGEQSVFYRRKTAASQLSIEDIDFDYIKSAKLVYATGLVQSLSLSCREVVREVFELAVKNDILVAYDINFSKNVWSENEAQEAFEDVAPYIDIIFLNAQDDIPALFNLETCDNIIKKLTDKGIKTVVIKQKEGLYAFSGGNYITLPYLSANKIDSTGAEAAFNGAFLSFMLQGYDLTTCLKYADCLGSLQIQKIGAARSIPSLDEVNRLYKEKYE